MRDIATPDKGQYAVREYPEEFDPSDRRGPFQHDRDRIIHSTALKRLQYKTQVYMIHEGDLYRTRLTHTLEVAQISRSLAIQLDANVDLAEAIALAHDLGHTPFGHAGEAVMRDLLKEKSYGISFEHNVQGYRVVTCLEERYPGFGGLNLTYAALEGLLRHDTIFDKQQAIQTSIPASIKKNVKRFWKTRQPGLEAQLVSMADIIAYASHDIEDALSVGLIDWAKFKKHVDAERIDFLRELIDNLSPIMKVYEMRNPDPCDIAAARLRYCQLSRQIINKLILEACKQTDSNIEKWGIEKGEPWENMRHCRQPVVALPDWLEKQVHSLVDDILKEIVYRDHRVMLMKEKSRHIIELMFETFMNEPGTLPEVTQDRLRREGDKLNKNGFNKQKRATVVADHIAGMTDKYAMDMYQILVEPYEKVL